MIIDIVENGDNFVLFRRAPVSFNCRCKRREGERGRVCATYYLCPSVSISRVISEGSTCVAVSLSLSLSVDHTKWGARTTQSGPGVQRDNTQMQENISLTTEHPVIMFSSQTHPASHLRLPFSEHQQPFQHLHTASAIPGMYYEAPPRDISLWMLKLSNFYTPSRA